LEPPFNQAMTKDSTFVSVEQAHRFDFKVPGC
jgi:hypothetical protein